VIVAANLLYDLQRLLKRFESDIRNRCELNTEIDGRLRAEYNKAKSVNRTAQAYDVWRDDYITQAAVAWILACVFIRFLEDNHLIEPSRLSGVGDRLQLARDQHTIYFQRNPSHTDREYLEYVFQEVAKLPSIQDLLNGSHNPISKLGPTGDGATELLEFWQKLDPTTGNLLHDFSDPEWKTRFLGDLYQDLSETARKRYALLQTPEFVEEFILDRTLMPAIDEFGLAKVRMIDPTCGSGHFLLGGFNRLCSLYIKREPATNVRVLVQRALDGLYGVDLNPNVIAIARFRLLLVALKASGVTRLTDSPAFRLNLAVGDALLHGPRLGGELERSAYLDGLDPLLHVYATEDANDLRRILGQQYHAVVGNPPYITVTDSALNSEYRKRFGSCYRQYSLAVPFMERFFNLAMNPDGYVGMITSNSFMKREFGKRLVEKYFPKWDVTHVIDTAGAYIPGHGTPTVILFARNRLPFRDVVRCVLGTKGEPSTPSNPAEGLVWRAITKNLDNLGYSDQFISVTDIPRSVLSSHPWAMGGGGAVELFTLISKDRKNRLEDRIWDIGATALTRDDDVFVIGEGAAKRHGIPQEYIRPYVAGEDLRDWTIGNLTHAIWPYDKAGGSLKEVDARLLAYLWRFRTQLRTRVAYGLSQVERGLGWHEYSMLFRARFNADFVLAFANVSTHNHFVFSPGKVLFNAHAPVVILPKGATVDEHLSLTALLNSSTACFWMKQVSHNKGSTVDQHGARQRTMPFEDFFEFDVTKMKQFPVPLCDLASMGSAMHQLAAEVCELRPDRLIPKLKTEADARDFAVANEASICILRKMISLQEELDWRCYRYFGVIDEDLCAGDSIAPPLNLGERAFEILMARKMADDDLKTTWFIRHGATPKTELPSDWPDGYRKIVEQRIEFIESNINVTNLEQPQYKRRWQISSWRTETDTAIENALLDRLEAREFWGQCDLTSCSKLADRAGNDRTFMRLARVLKGREDFDLSTLVSELVAKHSVPLLPICRYQESGLRKRAVWERTWDLQRHEDRIRAEVLGSAVPEMDEARVVSERIANEVGPIPVPPKFKSDDFQEFSYWTLRGKLDVAKERFISFPFCERDVDPTLVIAWAGWDHLQQAQAIASYYERVKNHEGWTAERRIPLLAAILELLPWLKQWHNEIHPEYHERIGDFFQQFVADEARMMEITLDKIRAWIPPAQIGERGSRRRIS
jgi:hypothetical protein